MVSRYLKGAALNPVEFTNSHMSISYSLTNWILLINGQLNKSVLELYKLFIFIDIEKILNTYDIFKCGKKTFKYKDI